MRNIDVTKRGSYMEQRKAYMDAIRAMKEEAKETKKGEDADEDTEKNK